MNHLIKSFIVYWLNACFWTSHFNLLNSDVLLWSSFRNHFFPHTSWHHIYILYLLVQTLHWSCGMLIRHWVKYPNTWCFMAAPLHQMEIFGMFSAFSIRFPATQNKVLWRFYCSYATCFFTEIQRSKGRLHGDICSTGHFHLRSEIGDNVLIDCMWPCFILLRHDLK